MNLENKKNYLKRNNYNRKNGSSQHFWNLLRVLKHKRQIDYMKVTTKTLPSFSGK